MLTASPQIATRAGLAALIPSGGIAVELGVAAADFSVALLEANPSFARLYSVDRWADHHDAAEAEVAARRLAPFGRRSSILHSSFADAALRFAPGYFDFIYIDGYAHTGQEAGATLRDWWPLLRPGGIFAGHDYDPAWPLTVAAVDAHVATHGLALNLTTEVENPSWWLIKPAA